MIIVNHKHSSKKKKATTQSLSLLALALLFCSCKDDVELSTSADDFYHVKIDNAYLPMLVRGNTQSNVILLFVQGGPGYPSIDFAMVDYPNWKHTIEKDFAIAYYDQRGFGNKQGNTDLSTITMAQYEKDILMLSTFLKARYKDAKVILLGHSFGGSLGYRYLVDHQDAGVVDAMISICGPYTHDGDNVATQRWEFRRNYLLNVSSLMISRGTDVKFWQEANSWALDNAPLDTDEKQKQWNKYVAKAEKFTEPTIGVKDYLKIGFASPYNIFSELQYDLNDKVASKLIKDEQRVDISSDLDQIQTPILILASRFDDQAPAEELQFIYNSISSSNKQFYLFANAGHNVFLDEPVELRRVVKEFCEAL